MPTPRRVVSRKKNSKPRPPNLRWRPRCASRARLLDGLRAAGLELRRTGLRPPRPPEAKPLDPILAALEKSPTIARLVGRLRIDGGFDDDTVCWSELAPAVYGGTGRRTLSLFTKAGRDRAVELALAATDALRTAGWRVRGAGATIGQAPRKSSGVWVANLCLVPLSPARAPRASMAR